jgi:uncharacterized protein YqgC (DUF456 family)
MMLDALFSVALVAAFGLHVFSLPANWILLGLFALAAVTGSHGATAGVWVALVLVAVAGEAAEWLLQDREARRAGASTQGSVFAMVGAVVGAIVGAPVAFGLGALVGAALGAYGGCLLGEMMRGVSFAQARTAAWGAMRGRVGGMVVKMSLGAGMLVFMLLRLWET